MTDEKLCIKINYGYKSNQLIIKLEYIHLLLKKCWLEHLTMTVKRCHKSYRPKHKWQAFFYI